jgi:hypothetical protein
MSLWMQDAEKTGLLKLLESREHSAASREEFLRTKMHLEAIEAQMRAAIAEERAAAALELAANAAVKNVRYLLATAVAAGLSAAASLLIVIIALAAHW